MYQKQSSRKPQTIAGRAISQPHTPAFSTPIPPIASRELLPRSRGLRLPGLPQGIVHASTTPEHNKVRGKHRESEDKEEKVNSLAELREWGKHAANERRCNEHSSKREKWGHIEVKVILKSIFEWLKSLLQIGFGLIIHQDIFSFPTSLPSASG